MRPETIHSWFQSAPSLRRATGLDPRRAQPVVVSIRALPAEGDEGKDDIQAWKTGFNPRPPCGGRPVRVERGG